MTLSQIFDEIRPRVEQAFWQAWLAEGFEPCHLKAPPAEVSESYWIDAKERCWAKAEARQVALYAEHGVWDHPEMTFADKAETASARPF